MTEPRARPGTGRSVGGSVGAAVATGVLCGVLGGVAYGVLYVWMTEFSGPEMGVKSHGEFLFVVLVAAVIGAVVSVPSTLLGVPLLCRARVGVAWWLLAGTVVAASVVFALCEVPPFFAVVLVASIYVAGCFAAMRWVPVPRAGACEGCGYDLSGIRGGVCPECGRGLTHGA